MSLRHVLLVVSLLTIQASVAPAWAQSDFGQAPGERSAQLRLPKSATPLWMTLRKTRIGEDARHGIYTASFPPEVRALDGTRITLSGFMLPMDATQKSKHFLLSRYTPVCFFCPPGEPNEVVEVVSRSGVKVTDGLITLSGRMTLTNNGEKGLFFRLDQGG